MIPVSSECNVCVLNGITAVESYLASFLLIKYPIGPVSRGKATVAVLVSIPGR